MCELFIPLEIQYYILKFVNDTNSYLNCRLVCKNWYNEMKNIKVFEDGKMIKKIIFSDNTIKIIDNNNNILKKVCFNLFGETIIESKNKYGFSQTVTHKPPYLIKSKEFISNNLLVTKEYDIRTDNVKTQNFPIMTCNIC